MTENPGHRSYDELFIGGQWRKPANPQQLAVISPHSEEPVGHVQVGRPRGRRRRRRRRAARLRPRPVATDDPCRSDGQGRTARRDLRQSHRRDGRPDHRRDGVSAQFQPAGPGGGRGVAHTPGAGCRARLPLGGTPPGRARRGTSAQGPGRGGRGDRAVERAAIPDHAQVDPGPDRGMHGHHQARTRNTLGRFVVGRNDRAAGPARRRGVGAARRYRCRRGAGAPSGRGQDRVHRLQCRRAPHRRAVRRAAQAGQPGTGRQVGGDHPRRRRHRQDRGRAEDAPA